MLLCNCSSSSLRTIVGSKVGSALSVRFSIATRIPAVLVRGRKESLIHSSTVRIRKQCQHNSSFNDHCCFERFIQGYIMHDAGYRQIINESTSRDTETSAYTLRPPPRANQPGLPLTYLTGALLCAICTHPLFDYVFHVMLNGPILRILCVCTVLSDQRARV